MEDPELGLSFDFEGGLDAVAAASAAPAAPPLSSGPAASSAPSSAPHEAGKPLGFASSQEKRPGYRQTVCRHWLRSLCMKGDACGYLHQLDKARMPLCRFYARFGVCREPDCIYKHTLDDIKECNMYKMGFCPNGPDCRYRHEKLPGPPPSVEENFSKLQQQAHAASGAHSSRYHQPRQGASHTQADGRPWQQYTSNAPIQASEENFAAEELENLKLQPVQTAPKQQSQSHVQQQASANGPSKPQKLATISVPLPAGISRYFIVKSNNRENLELSVQRGVWATHRNNEAKLNEAFDTSDNVILVFSVNETRHFQGCARMMSKAGSVAGGAGWKHSQGTAHYGRNFRLKWLKLCELSFNKTRHLRNPYNENLPVKISRDCQELEPSVGEQLASLLYMEPDSDLMALAKEAEAKREEQNAQAGATVQHSESDANIVPFEDNDDEQDEYDSEEEEEFNQNNVSASQGRGRSNMGRGQMWRPMGKGGRGMRSVPSGRGMNFQHNVGMGINYGMGPGEGYNMPVGMFSAPPAMPVPGFPPYGSGFGTPNFPNMAMNYGGPMEGPVPGPGMMYPGRPPPPTGMFPINGPGIMGPGGGPGPMMVGASGQGSMMEPVRPHFMGGPSGPTGPARPMGMPFRPPFVSGNGRGGRGFGNQPRRRRNDRAAANGRPAMRSGPRSFSKGWQKTSAGGEGLLEAENEFEINPPQWQQRRDGSSFKGNTDTAILEEESESEDEAPRRSRHGEGKQTFQIVNHE
ncbi:hypothetical protein O6H91_12G027700 [Diphasiastrum complanatum]|uniref:Uncharacterized protein n=1 Tax=Diphasiastrum complanatum TaxID=34168 RepID=A0ACC2BZX3_DIPCM|nr:hypothetical protein O6H91_12G027700 [Diphasiastrum complanatum]